MWLGPPQQLAKVNVSEVPVASAYIKVSKMARNLGVIVDSQLTLSAQVSAVCCSGYYQLRLLAIQAFISCRLDYCNSMFYGIIDGLMSRLQSVRNAAARLVLGARRYDHIMPVLKELYRLPVRRRVDFKMATLVYLSLSAWLQHTWPPTVSWFPTKVVVSCVLPTQGHCVVRRTYSSYEDRCFAAAGPRLWNNLPAHLRQTDINFEQFKQLLKTFVFNCWERGGLWLTAQFAPSKSSYSPTYLLYVP